jgi:hypothetical protein
VTVAMSPVRCFHRCHHDEVVHGGSVVSGYEMLKVQKPRARARQWRLVVPEHCA